MSITFIVVDDFDLLGRLRRYDTDDRASTFAYDGTKRLGDDDTEAEELKRYHWCQSQLLGYEDGSNTYYIVPDMEGSTKIIIDSSQGVVNRLDYDHLGNLRNQTAAPQVEMLWRGKYKADNDFYVFSRLLYLPEIGINISIKKDMLIKPEMINNIDREKSCDWSDVVDFIVTLPIPGFWNLLVPSSTGPEGGISSSRRSEMCLTFVNLAIMASASITNCEHNPLCTSADIAFYRALLETAIVGIEIYCSSSPY